MKSKNYNSPTTIEVVKKIVTNAGDICSHFNDYYSSKADSILKASYFKILQITLLYLNLVTQVKSTY